MQLHALTHAGLRQYAKSGFGWSQNFMKGFNLAPHIERHAMPSNLGVPGFGDGSTRTACWIWVVQPTKISSLHPEPSLAGFDAETTERFDESLDDDESDSEEESDWSACISSELSLTKETS